MLYFFFFLQMVFVKLPDPGEIHGSGNKPADACSVKSSEELQWHVAVCVVIRAENGSWSLAIFCAISTMANQNCIKLYRWPIKISAWPAKPKALFSALMSHCRQLRPCLSLSLPLVSQLEEQRRRAEEEAARRLREEQERERQRQRGMPVHTHTKYSTLQIYDPEDVHVQYVSRSHAYIMC